MNEHSNAVEHSDVLERATDGPLCVLPSQWAGLWRNSSDSTPEGLLYTAILRDALYCWRGKAFNGRISREALQREARRWIFDDNPSYVTFVDVCQALGIDSARLRADLRTFETTGVILERSPARSVRGGQGSGLFTKKPPRRRRDRRERSGRPRGRPKQEKETIS